MAESDKKIGEAETVIMMTLSIISDVLEAFTLGTIGIFINLIVGGLILLWINMRKLKYTRFLIRAGLDMIPFVNFLPLKSLGVWATIKLANNPQVSAVVQKKVVAKGAHPV